MHQANGDRDGKILIKAARAILDYLTLPSEHTLLGLSARMGEIWRELGWVWEGSRQELGSDTVQRSILACPSDLEGKEQELLQEAGRHNAIA